MYRKTVSLLLAGLTLLPLVACGSGGDNEAAVQSETQVTETAAVSTADANGFLLDSLPADLDFKGTTVTTFGWSGNTTVEFTVDGENGEIVNDAIYRRNANTEERLNVKLEYHLPLGDYNARDAWVKEISTSILAGDSAYDISAGYSMSMATLAYQHYVQDMNKLSYLDFSKPWWPDNLQKESVINGKLYFASGDISPYMIYYMLTLYFNMGLIEDQNLEDPPRPCEGRYVDA